jgi:hypothetical protein
MKEKIFIQWFQKEKAQRLIIGLDLNRRFRFLHTITGIKNGQAVRKNRKLIVQRVSSDFSKELEITFWTVWTLDE